MAGEQEEEGQRAGNLVLMQCQQSSHNELLERRAEELRAVPKAFSGRQQCVSCLLNQYLQEVLLNCAGDGPPPREQKSTAAVQVSGLAFCT
ncbi:hypothetical protein STEG23_002626, partial [Scotinomys teguina]